MICSYSTLLHGAGPPQRQKKAKKEFPASSLNGHSLGQSVQTVCGSCPLRGRQTSQESHLHHCVLANLKEYHYRPFPSSHLSATDRLYPGFPARLLRCYLFHSTGRKKFCHSCRSVAAPRLRLLKWLTYLNCWIWLAGCSVILCLLSEPDTKIPSPAFVKVRPT